MSMLLPGVTGADHSWRKAEGQERRECARHRRLELRIEFPNQVRCEKGNQQF